MAYVIAPDLELGLVSLKVSNLDRSLDYYSNVIGLKLLTREGTRAELTVDGDSALVELVEVADAVITPPRTRAGLYHFAILVPDRVSLGLCLNHLVQQGERIGQADHLVSEALYLTDPDGNGIEIYRDRPRETWQTDADGQVRMTTDPIDWEGLLAEAGASAQQWSGMPAGTKIGHVHLHVGDLEQARQFYCELLGFEIMANMSSWGVLFVAAGGYHHHLGLNIWAGRNIPAPPANGTGLGFFTVCLPNAQALDEIVQRIEATGIEIYRRGIAYEVKDPFGTFIRLQSR
ncbi:VOC family protein [Paenibacillus senegalensis]|uniref:VOC family protein n=1 Tax=Paenibacillus senegalensis TaxID=1465766 RepID=UPI0002883800|nr:VOC family protein [Paenibacillus senegalensis]